VTKRKRTYTREFKLEALRLLETSGKSKAQIEQDLGLGAGCLSRWEKEYATEGEEVVHHSVYHTRDQARVDLFDYIESFYNRRRRHSALDYLSPKVYEQRYHQRTVSALLNSLSTKSGEGQTSCDVRC
jgi:transposase InsO family protein